ncbi:hypothetical protein ACFQ3S_14985 [Mucilaginibacter terrae]|uniref:plasmid mobilization protein n=1 Tax=Mucilaginibacter terrae TaxID=1955052 RepID=UPI003641556C
MARLTKKPEALRDHTIEIRVTQDEKAAIKTNASNRGMNTSDFLREFGLLKTGKAAMRSNTTISRELLIELKGHIGKIGSNLNQVAREVNRRKLMNEPTVPDYYIINASEKVDNAMQQLLDLLGYGY